MISRIGRSDGVQYDHEPRTRTRRVFIHGRQNRQSSILCTACSKQGMEEASEQGVPKHGKIGVIKSRRQARNRRITLP